MKPWWKAWIYARRERALTLLIWLNYHLSDQLPPKKRAAALWERCVVVGGHPLTVLSLSLKPPFFLSPLCCPSACKQHFFFISFDVGWMTNYFWNQRPMNDVGCRSADLRGLSSARPAVCESVVWVKSILLPRTFLSNTTFIWEKNHYFVPGSWFSAVSLFFFLLISPQKHSKNLKIQL